MSSDQSDRLGTRQHAKFPVLVYVMLAIGFILRSWYALSIPLGPGRDEPQHIRYVQFVADRWRAARPEDLAGLSYEESFEMVQPPLYYFVAAGIYSVTRSLGEERALLLLRLLSVLLSLGAVYVGYRALALFLPDERLILGSAVAMMVFLPRHIVISGTVNNDQLSWFLSAVVLYQIVRGLVRAPQPIKTGIVMGAALLTKFPALLLAGLGAVVMFYEPRRGWVLSRGWRRLVTYVVVVTGITGWWFCWNVQAFGSWVPHTYFHPPKWPMTIDVSFFAPKLEALKELYECKVLRGDPSWCDSQPFMNDLYVVIGISIANFWTMFEPSYGWSFQNPIAWVAFWAVALGIVNILVLIGAWSSMVDRRVFSAEQRPAARIIAVIAVGAFVQYLVVYFVVNPSGIRNVFLALPCIAMFFGAGVKVVLMNCRRLVSQGVRGSLMSSCHS